MCVMIYNQTLRDYLQLLNNVNFILNFFVN